MIGSADARNERKRCHQQGHTLTIRTTGQGHDEWYCAVCFCIPSTRELLLAYVEKHGGKVVS